MKFFDVLKTRRSIRRFQNKEVEKEKIAKILEAARSAPSAGNLQAYQIFVVRNQKIKNRLTKAALEQDFIAEAPLVLVFFADPERSAKRYGQRGTELYSLQDATIAASYAQLAIVDLALSSVWVGAFDENEVKDILDIRDEIRPIAILPVGYPDERPVPRPRRDLDDVVFWV